MTIQRLILNADDFGSNAQVNQAIVSSLKQGYCSNTTIMANMPGFEEAVELAHLNQFVDRVGLHLNLYEGVPLTEKVKRCSRICGDDGLFLGKNRPLLIVLSANERTALDEEIRAQITHCQKNGLPISHVDSHCHVHNEWGVIKLLIRATGEFDIPAIRLCRHRDITSKWWKNKYRVFVNYRLRVAGLAGTNCFGTVEDAIRLHQQIMKPFAMEVMLHPTLDEDGQIVDFFLEGALAASIDKLFQITSIKSSELDSYKPMYSE